MVGCLRISVRFGEMLTLASWGRRLLVVNKPESMNQASDNWAVYHPNQRIFCKCFCGMGRPVFVLMCINSRGLRLGEKARWFLLKR